MATTKTVHVYSCYHVEVEYIEGDSEEPVLFVFVEGPCSTTSCISTDPMWFAEGAASPSTEELELLQRLTSQFWRNKAKVGTLLTTFDGLGRMPEEEIAAAASNPEIIKISNLLDADARQSEVDKWLNLAETETLLKYARGFPRPNQRPLFDFAESVARYYIEHAKVNIQKLDDAVHELIKIQTFPPLKATQPRIEVNDAFQTWLEGNFRANMATRYRKRAHAHAHGAPMLSSKPMGISKVVVKKVPVPRW